MGRSRVRSMLCVSTLGAFALIAATCEPSAGEPALDRATTDVPTAALAHPDDPAAIEPPNAVAPAPAPRTPT